MEIATTSRIYWTSRIVRRPFTTSLLQIDGKLMVRVQHIQFSLGQSVRITLKLFLQRKDYVDVVDEVCIGHAHNNDWVQQS